ncbi:MAG: aminoglycoside phosphotransferase family protein [Bacteroidales bacterium]
MDIKIIKIAGQFVTDGKIESAVSYGGGHINDTFRVTASSGSNYILQKINKNVFKTPLNVVNNIEKLLQHFNHIGKNALQTFPAFDGKKYYLDEQGDYWRLYNFVSDAKSYEVIENETQAFEAGKAFGSFLHDTLALNPSEFKETIPNFHHLGKRYEKFRSVIEQNPAKRLDSVKTEVDIALAHFHIAESVEKSIASGELPVRVTHNDTKLNNALFDINTGKGICVIDLDTVMPGLLMYDYGDMVRTFTSPLAEDDTHFEKVKMRIEIFKQLTHGYMSELSNAIKKAEIENLVLGAKYMTLIMAVRFLTDYIEGDVYYKIKHPNHNIDRARNQFALLKSIENHEDELQKFIYDNYLK